MREPSRGWRTAAGGDVVSSLNTPLTSSTSERGPAVGVHDLKVWPPHWALIDTGQKRVEIRRDDRPGGFRVGDVLVLREWEPDYPPTADAGLSGVHTGRVCQRTVTHVLRGGKFGLMGGYVALSLGPVAPDEPPGWPPDDPVEISGRILLAKGGAEEWCVFTGGPHPGSCETWEDMVDRAACEDYRRAGSGIAVRVAGPWRIVRDCPDTADPA